ncbi:MAG: right-handed parallel beta-helix repeat-containing protein, partial [Bacteroidales bacterium]|nr:right-handed parallel beta-helix repeat-containing protein [Bacteroidales bacterium]
LKSIVVIMCVLVLTGLSASAQSIYYVSNTGADDNRGSIKQPFKSIQKAIDTMQPGDLCQIRGGVYRETIRIKQSGEKNKPIRIQAYNNEKVIVDGTNFIKGKWKKHSDDIYKIKMPKDFEQLFFNRNMLVEARWPNSSFPEELWDRSSWAGSGIGSRYGKMVDTTLVRTQADWQGAIAVLNVAHQFRSWTRKVLTYDFNTATFAYKKNLKPITSYANATKQWEDDLYYLFGKMEALDAPGEWYLNEHTNELYVFSDEKDIKNGEFAYKARHYGLTASERSYFHLEGITFFACTMRLLDVENCTITNCRFEYPVYSREFNDPELKQQPAETRISGNYIHFHKNYIAYSQRSGLIIKGMGNVVENNIVHDVAWAGQGFGIHCVSAGKDAFVCTRNTVYNTGYSGIRLDGPGGWEASYNYVHHSAQIAKDCASIQCGNWVISGSIIHHNWVHDCYTLGKHSGGLNGGLGIRGDDQTRGLTVHHNVVWKCGRDGIIIKGDSNKVFNNTVFAIGSNDKEGNYISMHAMAEPHKPWLNQAPLLESQNMNSLIFNNIAFNIVGDRKQSAFPYTENMKTNAFKKEGVLQDVANKNFMPVKGASLIDAGTHYPGLTNGYSGKAPDIGAYEKGQFWKPGADWKP